MNIIDTPFLKKVGINRTENGALELDFQKDVHNHLETICAGAQYTLAESSSAALLQELFPDLVGKVIPVIRETKIKFKKPALSKITAFSTVTEESETQFRERFYKSGKAFISIDVKVRDMDEEITASGSYIWFLQKLD